MTPPLGFYGRQQDRSGSCRNLHSEENALVVEPDELAMYVVGCGFGAEPLGSENATRS